MLKTWKIKKCVFKDKNIHGKTLTISRGRGT